MRIHSHFGSIVLIGLGLLLSACASDPGLEGAGQEAPEAQQAREEQAQQEAAVREAAAREERAREAERRREAEEAARQAEQERARLQAQREAEEEARQRAELARQAAEREARQARQQARITELQAEIEANEREAASIDAANELLREAIVVAGNLAATLNEEGQKYSEIDPESGATVEERATETLSELSTELERLRAEAASLQSGTGGTD